MLPWFVSPAVMLLLGGFLFYLYCNRHQLQLSSHFEAISRGLQKLIGIGYNVRKRKQ